jgi:hypothetical protein
MMSNKEIITLVETINRMGFAVIELRQEQHDGRPSIVEDNGRGAIGTILVRIVPMPKN